MSDKTKGNGATATDAQKEAANRAWAGETVTHCAASSCSDNYRYRFPSHEEYIKWCEAMVTKIYYGQIAMNDQSIREVVSEIGLKLWLQEGVELFPYPNHQDQGR